jgi:large subunit ribosomal protein L17
MLANMVSALLQHGRIHTTLAKAKEATRLADRLISLGKDGSIHSRRQAFRVLRDRTLVKRLFADVAPLFLDCQGGYTRVLRLSPRLGDGAPQALFELTRFPAEPRKPSAEAKIQEAHAPKAETPAQAPPEEAKKPTRLFEGLREWFRLKKRGSAP